MDIVVSSIWIFSIYGHCGFVSNNNEYWSTCDSQGLSWWASINQTQCPYKSMHITLLLHFEKFNYDIHMHVHTIDLISGTVIAGKVIAAPLRESSFSDPSSLIWSLGGVVSPSLPALSDAPRPGQIRIFFQHLKQLMTAKSKQESWNLKKAQQQITVNRPVNRLGRIGRIPADSNLNAFCRS